MARHAATREQCIAALKTVYEGYGYSPTESRFMYSPVKPKGVSRRSIRQHWPTWLDALTAAGLPDPPGWDRNSQLPGVRPDRGRKQSTKAVTSSERTDWRTPPALFNKLNQEFNFTLDVSADADNALCQKYIDEKGDGLTAPWVDYDCLCKCHRQSLRQPVARNATHPTQQPVSSLLETRTRTTDSILGAGLVAGREHGSSRQTDEQTPLSVNESSLKSKDTANPFAAEKPIEPNLRSRTSSTNRATPLDHFTGALSFGKSASETGTSAAPTAAQEQRSSTSTTSQQAIPSAPELSRGISSPLANRATGTKLPSTPTALTSNQSDGSASCPTCNGCVSKPAMVWSNPPYSRGEVVRWVMKAVAEANTGTTSVLLLPARTESPWFHAFAGVAREVRLLLRRVKFLNPDGTVPDGGSTFPSIVMIFGPHSSRRRDYPNIRLWDWST